VTAVTPHPGFFIAFEGGEGSGKSTQVTRLQQWLIDDGYPVTRTREPGATRIGQKIRALLLDPASTDMDPRAEALLYAADRAQHAATLLHPALAAGHVVITDRYVDSSMAMQGHARELGVEDVRHLSMWGSRNLVPDLTLLLDIDPRAGVRRALDRGPATRFELEDPEFHLAVRQGFLDLAAAEPHRYAVIDAAPHPDTVELAVRAAVVERLSHARGITCFNRA
jgi:dTMP kinase